MALTARFDPQVHRSRVDKQVNGLVLFGTQPSSHVKVSLFTRAWLERNTALSHLPA